MSRDRIATSAPPAPPGDGRPTTSSVDPPPMSTTSTGPAPTIPAGRWAVAPAKDSLPSSSPDNTSGRTP